MQTTIGLWKPTIPPQRQEIPAQQHLTLESGALATRQLLPRPRDPSADGPSSIFLDRYHRRQRTNVTIACDQCKLKRVKCNGKKPCSRCSSKSLACAYEQGVDGRRGRNSSTEVQTLSERVDSYERVFQILRDSSSTDAVRILHHLRSQHKDNKSEPGSYEDAALSAALKFAKSLSSRSTTPSDPSPRSPLDWQRRTTSSISDTASASGMSEGSAQKPGMRNDAGSAAPLQSSPRSDQFPASGSGSAVPSASYATSDNESQTRTATPSQSQSSVPATSPEPTGPAPSNALPWFLPGSTNFRQANAWLDEDLNQIHLWLTKKSDKTKEHDSPVQQVFSTLHSTTIAMKLAVCKRGRSRIL